MEERLKILLYGYRKKDCVIETQYGLLSYSEWLAKEKKRIEKDLERKAEVDTRDHSSGLRVNEVRGCKCEFCKRAYPV